MSNDEIKRQPIPFSEAGPASAIVPPLGPAKKKVRGAVRDAMLDVHLPNVQVAPSLTTQQARAMFDPPDLIPSRRKAPKGAAKCIYFRDVEQLDQLERLVQERGVSAASIFQQLVQALLDAHDRSLDKTIRVLKLEADIVL
jgi:hypothetical protein